MEDIMPYEGKYSSISVSLPEDMQRELDIFVAIRRVKDRMRYSRSSFIEPLIQELLDSNREEIEDYKNRVFNAHNQNKIDN